MFNLFKLKIIYSNDNAFLLICFKLKYCLQKAINRFVLLFTIVKNKIFTFVNYKLML